MSSRTGHGRLMVDNATEWRGTSAADLSDPEVEGKLRRAKVTVSAPPHATAAILGDHVAATSLLGPAPHTENQGRENQLRPAHRRPEERADPASAPHAHDQVLGSSDRKSRRAAGA
jgi:hypothetical protein